MYEMPLRVRFSEVDEKATLSEVALLNYLQDCATLHSEDLGFGMEWLFNEGKGWFVTKWQIDIYRMPKMGEYINVITYPTKVRGFFGIRDFEILDSDKNRLSIAHSEWVYMDHKKGAPARVPNDMIEGYGMDAPIDNDWDKGKLSDGDDIKKVGEQVVTHHHLDYNRHMNNVYHLQTAVSVLPDDFVYDRIAVEYRNQAKENDILNIFESNIGNKKIISLKNGTGNDFCVLSFKKRG